MTPPPLFVLGVSRSGTTLLRVILDRSPGIAIPDESFFIPLLARRQSGNVDPGRGISTICDGCRRSVLGSLRPRTSLRPRRRSCHAGDAIAAIFEAYAAKSAEAALGRQDADVHASPTAARPSLPHRAVRPPDPRRARRGALVPAHARGDLHPDLGASGHAFGVRVPVAKRGLRGTGAGGASRAGALSRGPLRESRRSRRGRRGGGSATSRAFPTSPRCSITPEQSTCLRSPTSSGSCSR